jgi:5,10-methylenetetrahydromethanopterin reductase
MRIGWMSNTNAKGTIDDVVAEAGDVAADGLSTFWMSQIFGMDALTALAIVGREVPGIEVGTAVVPTYPRHPMALAQSALTTQLAAGGRLCLGIGLSHRVVVEGMWGMSFDRPVRHMREYLDVLMPLLDQQPVNVEGEEYRVRGAIAVPGASRPPVLIAALGPKMLHLAGSMADGTSTWCTGVRTLADYTIPTLRQAAADAGRPEPRVVASFPICVTDDVAAARARAAKVFAVYTNLPSYRAMMDREGVADASGLAVVGSDSDVRDQLAEVAAAGVSDLNAAVFAGNPEDLARTRAVLAAVSGG